MTFEPQTEPAKESRTNENTKPQPSGGPTRQSPDVDGIWRNGTVGADAHKDDERQRNDSLATVLASFNWFAQAAQIKVKALGEDLKKSDDPDMVHQVLMGLLEIALGAGAAAAGLKLAKLAIPDKLVTKVIGGKTEEIKIPANELTKEFLKNLFKGGITAGVSAGRQVLGSKPENVIDSFINSQLTGIVSAAKGAERHFIHSTRHEIQTADEAKALEAGCSDENMKAAAQEQYEATRDAWVCYLAQAKYGARSSKGAVQKDDIDVGQTTTNMGDQGYRERLNKGGAGFVPDKAPEFKNAIRGGNTGVLTVEAGLPAIDLYNVQMAGTPTVKHAFLNGVNSAIRDQYKDVPLAHLRIPRQIMARAEGESDFTINIDERGNVANYLPEKDRRWLARRATVGHPQNGSLNDFQKYQAGLEILLSELVPRSFTKTWNA